MRTLIALLLLGGVARGDIDRSQYQELPDAGAPMPYTIRVGADRNGTNTLPSETARPPSVVTKSLPEPSSNNVPIRSSGNPSRVRKIVVSPSFHLVKPSLCQAHNSISCEVWPSVMTGPRLDHFIRGSASGSVRNSFFIWRAY